MHYSPASGWLTRASCGYPHLRDGCGNPQSAASGRMFYLAGHVVDSRRVNLMNSAVNDVLFFNSSVEAKKEALKVD